MGRRSWLYPASNTMAPDIRVTAEDLPDTLPLLPIMVQLEQEMQSISSGLWRHDFEQIARSADNRHPGKPRLVTDPRCLRRAPPCIGLCIRVAATAH